MFGFLKDKLKSALSKFSKDVETEVEPLEEKTPSPEPKQEKESQEEKKPVQKEKPHETKEKKIHAKKESASKEEQPKFHAEKKVQPSEPVLHDQTHAKEEVIPAQVSPNAEPSVSEPPQEKKGFFSRLKDRFSKKDQVTDHVATEPTTEPIQEGPSQKVSEIVPAEREVPSQEKIHESTPKQIPEKKTLPVHPKTHDAVSRKKGEAKEEHPVKKEHFVKKDHAIHHEPEQKPRLHSHQKTVHKTSEVQTPDEEKREIERKELELETEEKSLVSEPQTPHEKPGFFGKMFGKKPEEKPSEAKSSTGFFTKLTEVVTKKAISNEKFEELFWELEMVLLEQNVAVEVIELIKENLRKELVDTKVLRGKIDEVISASLKESIDQALSQEPLDLFSMMEKKKPLIIVFVGINGSGKTTTIAKFIRMLQNHHKTCVVAAADTFRAAAIQQLEEHTTNLGVKLIKHDYHADPAAVAFDAVKYAEARHLDCVLIDTAGRLHSNINLMDEMKKIIRVAKPDVKLFVGESVTGNDCIEQAKQFHAAVGIDGIILAKADIDDKGGAALSVSYVTQKPILYLGMGQTYDDLAEFDKEKIIEQMVG